MMKTKHSAADAAQDTISVVMNQIISKQILKFTDLWIFGLDMDEKSTANELYDRSFSKASASRGTATPNDMISAGKDMVLLFPSIFCDEKSLPAYDRCTSTGTSITSSHGD
jgi:hypothetical protein